MSDIQIKVLTEQLMQAVDVGSWMVVSFQLLAMTIAKMPEALGMQPPLASCETVEGTQASI